MTVGDITIVHQSSSSPNPSSPNPSLPNPSYSLLPTPYSLIILPSMGFGTGHHQTTRLCLAAMQRDDVKRGIAGGNVLDVGTGSGILALAGKLLGAARATGIDDDADAIRSAEENLDLNADLKPVAFEIADLRAWLASGLDGASGAADVVTANLTGALLVKSAGLLAGAVRSGGHLIVSGILKSEETLVTEAFVQRTSLVSITSEDEWICLVLKKP